MKKVYLLTHPVSAEKRAEAVMIAQTEKLTLIDVKFMSQIDPMTIARVDDEIWVDGKPKPKRKPRAKKTEAKTEPGMIPLAKEDE